MRISSTIVLIAKFTFGTILGQTEKSRLFNLGTCSLGTCSATRSLLSSDAGCLGQPSRLRPTVCISAAFQIVSRPHHRNRHSPPLFRVVVPGRAIPSSTACLVRRKPIHRFPPIESLPTIPRTVMARRYIKLVP